jgi:hypothetical protein
VVVFCPLHLAGPALPPRIEGEVNHGLNTGNLNWRYHRSDIAKGGTEAAMFKASVIAFAIFICGAMLTIAHYDAHFAQLPKSVLMKRAV